jgi:hypothetical protein
MRALSGSPTSSPTYILIYDRRRWHQRSVVRQPPERPPGCDLPPVLIVVQPSPLCPRLQVDRLSPEVSCQTLYLGTKENSYELKWRGMRGMKRGMALSPIQYIHIRHTPGSSRSDCFLACPRFCTKLVTHRKSPASCPYVSKKCSIGTYL